MLQLPYIMTRFKVNMKKGKLTLLAVASFMLLAGVSTAYALTNELPAPGQMQAGGVNGRLDLHLKKLSVATVIRNKMAAYYPASDTTANGKGIKITTGNEGKVCHVDEAKLSGSIDIIIEIGNDSKTYSVPIDKVCDTDKFYGRTFDFPDGQLINDSGTTKNKAKITVFYNVTPQLAADSGSDLNYRMELVGDNKNNGILALRANDDPTEFGLRSAYDDDPSKAPNETIRAEVPFGYPCSENVDANSTRAVKLYDADSVFGDTYMWVEHNGQKLDRNEYNESAFRLIDIDSWDGANKRWKVSASNRDFNMITMTKDTVVRGDPYALVVLNTGAGRTFSNHYNTLSVGIPQDSIYSLGNCTYALTPEINIDKSTYVYYPDIKVDGSISKSGVDPPEQHSWEIYAVRYPDAPSTTNLTNKATGGACSNVPGGYSQCSKISPSLTYDTKASHSIDPYTGGGPDPVDTHLCFFTRIQNPTDSLSDDDVWAYSNMKCSVSVKKPRVQFLGSDLRVGGNAASSYYNVNGKNYGSWVEYGMFSTGNNVVVGSGNGLRDGNGGPTSDWSKLTFANTTSPYGGYNPVPVASSAYTYFKALPVDKTNAPSGLNPDAGVYDLGAGGNIGTIKVTTNGRTLVIRKTGQLRISNDIIVDNIGITSGNNISQVVIVADSIVIGPGATRIDAWLITSPTGYIDTCGTGTTEINSSTCPQTLTVNGPVYTKQLKLRRTAGNEPPAQLGDPAERFNLRPDAQLWAYTYANKADYAQTDYVQELPPRY